MHTLPKTYINWSSGKDCALCLYKVLQRQSHDVVRLLTTINAAHNRISMHGVHRDLLIAQSRALRIPLQTIELPEMPGMQEYELQMLNAVNELKDEGCTHALFGDIFLEDLRTWRENKLREAGIVADFPLWKIPTKELIEEFLNLGFRAIVVCVNAQYLDKSFCGREINRSFINDLPSNVDPCGENGEFHSFVFDGPIFREAIPLEKGEVVYRTYPAPKSNDDCFKETEPEEVGFYFCDLSMQNNLANAAYANS